MSSMSSLADASSGAGEELSFTKYGKTMGHEPGQIRGPLSSTAQWKSNDSDVRNQLFLKAAEAKKWQDSVLHLAGVATGKDEELNLERSRNIQMAAALERAEDAAELRQLELESVREENRAALQQVAALQSEMQSILSTCSLLESRSIQLESVLQQERNARKLASENLERVRVEAAAALDQADWCRERSRQEVLELQVRLHAADSELQAAHSDRQHALRFAESLHVSTAALAHESQREVNQSLYLQQEVQRLVRVCSEQRKQQAHQHEQILSLQLLVETLEARLQEGMEVRNMLERDRNEKILLQNQLRTCLGNFSEVCVRQQLLVSFVEEARVFLAQLLADLGFAQQLLALARYGGEASVFIDFPALTFVRADEQIESQTLGVEEKDVSRLTSMDIALEKVDKERKVSRTASQDQLAIPEENVLLDYTRDKQNELHTLLSLGDHGTGCEDLEGGTLGLHRELESCQNRMEEYETALAEMEAALEKAERERNMCESQLRKDLEERNAQLAIAKENVLKGCETAEGLREQIAILQKGKDRTETSQSKRLNEIEKVCELEGAMNKTLALAEATLAAERQTMQEKEARYVREVEVAVAAAEEVRVRLEESERMRRAVVEESDRMEREQQVATAHAAELEAEVARLQEEVCTAHKEASCLQGRLEAQLATLQTQLENIIQGQTQLEDIIQRNQHEKEEFQDRIEKLAADREEYQGKLTEAQQHVQRVQDESAEAQAKADAALERMENEMADVRVTLAEAQQHQFGEETRSSCKCSEFQMLQQQLQDCEMQLVGARQTEAAMREEAQSLRGKNDDLQEKIEDLQVKLVETVETQVLASRGGSAGDKRERGASCEVAEDLRELREKIVRLQDVESKLVAAEERLYITEEELQQACDTAEELRQQLQEARQEVRVLSSELQKVSGRSGSREKEIQETNQEELEKVVADLRRQLADAQADGGGGYGPGGLGHGGGAASGDGEESIGEEIEEEVMCDGFCETAEDLRRRLSALEGQKDKEMEERLKEGELKSAMILQTQRLEAELKHAQEELAKERERRERRLELLSKGDDDSFDNEAECKGGCETAQQLRHELHVAEARSDDAELENEVLQRKLALCQSELEAIRSKYHVPENFFSSDA